MKRMPTLFVGHGSPMMALEHTETTNTFKRIGQNIINNYGKPKAILAISAHWYADGTYVQSTENPKQIYDMYGFPQELYEVVYPAKGDSNLTKEVQKLLGNSVSINDTWGIDHGMWTVLVHMFPDASIPVSSPIYYFAQIEGVSQRFQGTEANRLSLLKGVEAGQVRKVLVKVDVNLSQATSRDAILEELKKGMASLLPYYEATRQRIEGDAQ